ncbi:MAG: response regulator [Bizionia sp.]|nr:response regulator [Bizionia sp.]
MTQKTNRFLIVDDDPINNFLTKTVLKKSFEAVHVNDFTVPEEGLEFIKSGANHNANGEKTILFLDINMPTLTGWQFLEAFKLFDESIRAQYTIYILSSSINHSDIKLAKEHQLILDFIEKPLNKIKLANILS